MANKINLVVDERKSIEDNLIRCFISIDFPDDVIKEVARVQEELEKVKFMGKLTELENLHLTLKFLGEIPIEKVEEVRTKLREIEFKEFECKLGETGVFSIRGNPKIAWIKVEGEGVWELQKKIDERMNEQGFKREERFMSHLTIARIKHVKEKTVFVDRVKNLGIKSLQFKVDKFKLMKSELRMLGPVYSQIEEFGNKE